MKTLLLIDANSLIHRCFHALPPLNAPDGRPTQSLYGISNILLRLLKDEKPEYAAALFDRPEPTFRKEKFEKYKAQRPKAPDELVSQIVEARYLFLKFGIKTFEKPGFEADDLIATLATKFSAGGGSLPDRQAGSSGGKDLKDLQVVILTGDLDTLQMVDDGKIAVRTFKKGVSETALYDEQAVFDRYGLKPEQLIDYKALVGDQSDNIPGVAGVGEKTATALLQKYGTLKNVYKHLKDEPKLGKKLEGTEKQAEFSRSLVVLEKEAPIEVGDIDELRVQENRSELQKYFQDLGFESLVKRVVANNANPVKNNANGEPKKERKNLGRSRGANSKQASIFGSVSSVSAGNEEKIFVFGPDGSRKDFRSDKLKIGFGLKSLLKELWKRGEDLSLPYFDLEVAFWLLDPDFKDYLPEAVFKKFLKKQWRGNLDDFKTAFEFSKRKIGEYEMEKVFHDIEMPLLRVLAEMERVGVLVNPEKLKILEKKIDGEIEGLAEKIYKVVGEEFNLNSPQQLGKILFEKLGVNPKKAKKTSGGSLSTREESLLVFREEHPVINLILEYRENFKIQTTYVKPLEKLIRDDGRVHTEFVQTGAATGRLSSRNPNLQNVPQESKWSRELRSVFESPKGSSFVSFDYSQIELRVFAALTGDKAMLETFRRGADIHTLTASKVLGIPLEKVRHDERRLAKTLNFGLLYGMGVTAFARSSGLEREKAKSFIETYFREFKEIRDWQERTKKEARKYGFTRTLTGRRRYLLGINSLAPQVVAEAERAAINHPLQGLAADIMKMAMIRSREKLEAKKIWGEKARMLLTIHDELLFEVADDMIRDVSEIVKKEMESAFDLGVPLGVEVTAGKNWGNLTKLENRK